jgi:hypothetical protein
MSRVHREHVAPDVWARLEEARRTEKAQADQNPPDQKTGPDRPDPFWGLLGPFSYRPNPDPNTSYYCAFWIDDQPPRENGASTGRPIADVHPIGSDSERLAALLTASPRLLRSLRACIAALEAAGADGEPGEMPAPALDEARRLVAELEG